MLEQCSPCLLACMLNVCIQVWCNLHLGELGSGATGHLGHAELLELGLELIKLAEELVPTLLAKLVSLNLDCSDQMNEEIFQHESAALKEEKCSDHFDI